MRLSVTAGLAMIMLSIETLYSHVEIVSVYPTQNYLTAPRETDLYAVFNLDLDESTVVDTNIVVFAERTGTHLGNLSYDAGSRTLTFDPDNDFIAGERVRITLTNRIRGASGESFRGFTWHFTVQTFAEEGFEFVYKGDIPAGPSFYLEAADFNNDGYPDIIAKQDIYYDRVYLYLNNGNGGFYYHATVLDTEIPLATSGQLVDINKDGWTDIYIPGPHIILINQRNTEFEMAYADSVLLNQGFGALADFDNDGILDIVASHSNPDSQCMYAGSPNISFSLRTCPDIPKLAEFFTPPEEVLDLNADGFVDIITSMRTYGTDSIIVLINEGNFTFGVSGFYDPKTGSQQGFDYTNDLDGDGDLDYAVFGFYRSDSARFILYNDGDGAFRFDNYQLPRYTTGSVFGGDIDADGDIDLMSGTAAVVSAMPVVWEGHIYIFRNDGPDSLTLVSDYLIYEGVERAIFVDYDLDGDLDIVGIRRPGYHVFWMENTSILSATDDDGSTLPEGYALYQNYPNPFNATTTISYQLPASSHVNLKIYDINGREIRTLVNKIEDAGKHQIRWNGLDSRGKEVSSGIYFIHIRAEWFLQTRKMILLR